MTRPDSTNTTQKASNGGHTRGVARPNTSGERRAASNTARRQDHTVQNTGRTEPAKPHPASGRRSTGSTTDEEDYRELFIRLQNTGRQRNSNSSSTRRSRSDNTADPPKPVRQTTSEDTVDTLPIELEQGEDNSNGDGLDEKTHLDALIDATDKFLGPSDPDYPIVLTGAGPKFLDEIQSSKSTKKRKTPRKTSKEIRQGTPFPDEARTTTKKRIGTENGEPQDESYGTSQYLEPSHKRRRIISDSEHSPVPNSIDSNLDISDKETRNFGPTPKNPLYEVQSPKSPPEPPSWERWGTGKRFKFKPRATQQEIKGSQPDGAKDSVKDGAEIF
ncbi:uncharacterized protein LY89DRAFT_734392 [Mollisia scopiformis]|uniref:Uncharacterized protein n=1 Tax=Mollisia scopiformis TaxID=149040 RepID=A0A194X7Y5_MOLSC|nr:uncharacterized protein LY89DRAFT_734392 [Mollisia scopiformis]KUJ16281.1 hypothetical protein LY89DRAFT_734392 [Mollisia scopiformis]